MGVCIAEYLGQRTDINSQQIMPAGEDAQCPFMHNTICHKFRKGMHPICSVRTSTGSLWITCENRFCATRKNVPLCDYQSSVLLMIAKTVFSQEVTREQVCVKREVELTVNDISNYKADYIMTLRGGVSPYPGPDRFVLEMQGGGETSNTGKLSAHVRRWVENPQRTNLLLRSEIQGVGPIQTNAWRRQQEQFIVKGNISLNTWKGYGIAFCVGSLLYDYLREKVRDYHFRNLRQYNWTLALIGISEDVTNPPTYGPIPLCIDPNKLLFTNYQTFVQALINQGEPTLDAFSGGFIDLNNHEVAIPKDGE